MNAIWNAVMKQKENPNVNQRFFVSELSKG